METTAGVSRERQYAPDDPARARQGDADAFSRAITAMEGDLYRVARSILPDDADIADAMQETALRAWRGVHRLRDAEVFDRWVLRILINQCRSILRRRGRQAWRPLDEGLGAAEAGGRGMAEGRDSAMDVRRALDALPEMLRLPLVLHHVLGYDIAEVGRMVGASKPAVASRIHRAREQLRALLKEEG